MTTNSTNTLSPLEDRVCFLAAEIKRLEDELDLLRMRLTACDVITQANTIESAALVRTMSDYYKSAALESVIEAVDLQMQYRAALKNLRKAFAQESNAAVYIDAVLNTRIESFKELV